MNLIGSQTINMKTQTYRWQGKTLQGKIITGEQSASDIISLKNELRNQGILVLKIHKKISLSLNSYTIRAHEITVLTRQISTLFNAGIPLLQTLELIARGTNHAPLKTLLLDLKNAIASGHSVASTFRKHPRYFNELYCNLVAAGEQSGTLDILFDRIANYREKTDYLTNKIKKALYYPLTIFLTALIITLILLLFVVPQFQTLFSNCGKNLPAATQFIITLSNALKNNFLIILIANILIAVLVKVALKKIKFFALLVDKYLLHLPVFGKLIKHAIFARLSQTLATIFAAGLPLVDALLAVANSTNNKIYKAAMRQVSEDVTVGQSLHLALKQTHLFPNLFLQLVAIGEESGTLEDMLNKIASIFQQEVDQTIDIFSSLLEPFVMIILGIIIGGLVIAMYLPIFKLGSVV